MPEQAPVRRKWIVASVMASTFIVAMEATIVATAMPSIVGELGGFSRYAWVFAAFMVAQTTTTPIFGKMADIFGRRPIVLSGLAIFLVASLLCGFAWSMTSLIAFRLLQGIGAGAIQPLNVTIIGDLYRMEERGKVQGFVAGVWAFAGVVGPLCGGIIVAHLTWAWIFWLNIPMGLIAMAGFATFLKERFERRPVRIDYGGALLFSVTILALLFILSEIDGPASTLGMAALVFLVSGAAFLWWEARAAEPIVSLELWSRRLVATCNAAGGLVGVLLIGLTTMLPLYMQGVLGQTPVAAGIGVTTLIVGWPLAVMNSRKVFRRIGVINTMRLGGFVLFLGALGTLAMGTDSSNLYVATVGFVLGIGMGFVGYTTIALVQDSVEWSMRGSATASNIFSRSLGSALGASVLGAILNFGLHRYADPASEAHLHAVLNSATGLHEVATSPVWQAVFNQSLHLVFWGVLVFSALCFAATYLIPADQVADQRRAPATR